MIQLYEDQEELINGVRKSMEKGNKRVLMQAATGSGKTIMGSKILLNAGLKGSKTWFVVPRKELLKQTSLTYDNFQINHSYVASGMSYNASAQNFICSMQTLSRRFEELTAPDLVIIDECHYGGSQVQRIIDWLTDKGSWIIGLSATPKKHNGDGMDLMFDDLVNGPSIRYLIDEGRLSGFKMYAPTQPDLSKVKTAGGDYAKADLQEWFDENGNALIGDAIKTYKTKALGKRGITFCSSIKESKKTAQAFTAAGVPAYHLDGTMDADTRSFAINQFADGHIMQLVSVDLMTFGFDLAAQVGRDITIEVMSDCAPTKSESKQLQKWGRVLRKKDYPALIFDHAGNAFRHGMPDQDREWSLQGRQKRKGRKNNETVVQMKQCEKCYFCHDPAPKCPNCGFVYPVQSRKIEIHEGELEEIKSIEIQKKKKKRMEVGRAKTYADLKKIAQERGYQPGWAYVMAKKKGLI